MPSMISELLCLHKYVRTDKMDGSTEKFNTSNADILGGVTDAYSDDNSSLMKEPGWIFIPGGGYQDSSIMSALPFGIILAFVILNILCIAWIIFGNTMVILAYQKFPILHSVSNYLLYHLAIVDLLAGFSGIYGLFYQLLPFGLIQNFACCALGQVFMGIPSYVSLLLLLVVTIDRYIAINHPLQYQVLVTVERVRMLILVLWMTIIVLTTVSIIDWYIDLDRRGKRHCYEGTIHDIEIESRIMGILYAPLFIIVLVGTMSMYAQIFFVARKQMASQNSNMSTEEYSRESLKMNLKIVKTVCIVIGLFFLCWCPFVVMVTIDLWSKVLKFKSIRSMLGTTFVIVYNLLYLLVLANSGMNPIIYAFRLKDFNNAFKKLLHPCFKKNEINAYDSSANSNTGTRATSASMTEQKEKLTSQE